MKPGCVVVGGGGHAKSVIDALRSQGKYRPAAITDPRIGGQTVLGVTVAGGDESLGLLRKKGIRHFVIGLGGVANNKPRALLFTKALAGGLLPATVVHATAVVAESSRVGRGTVALALAVVNPDAEIGENVILNTASVVEHDARVGSHVHLCPGACLSGGVTVGEGAFIGMGAVVKEGVHIGEWAVIGAGAVVLHDVPARGRVAGVPARSLGKIRR